LFDAQAAGRAQAEHSPAIELLPDALLVPHALAEVRHGHDQ
jgi:hypothetical protein